MGVTFKAASLHYPYFWRANFGKEFKGKGHAPIQLNNPDWSSAPWSSASYADLQALMEEGFLEGRERKEALSRIACLVYSNTAEKCGQAGEAVEIWQGELNKARGPDREKALGDILHELICVRDVNAIFVLRGLLRDSARGMSQIAAAGDGALELIHLILNGNQNGECPVSAQLTFEDKLQLSKQKEGLEKQKRKKSDEVMLQHSSESEIPPEPEISPPPVDELFGDRSTRPEGGK